MVAGLARFTRDIALAEDLASEALVIALETWPATGVPRAPGAWLLGTAKHRALDRFRRDDRLAHKTLELARDLEAHDRTTARAFESVEDDGIDDDLLRLVFVAAHPIVPAQGRVALTLRLLGGLTTAEIARAFLTTESTIAQRIVRAKRTIAQARVPFEVPAAGERSARLASVLEIVYLIFNEGYAATAGDDWLRPALCEDALRLGRVLAHLMPLEPEVAGLVALMELHASRLRARTSPSGEPVLLLDQARGRWDHLLIGRGLASLARAERLSDTLGPYTLQAAIAACHARATRADDTDWARIAALYDALATLHPTPVIELNRAVAVGMAYGPAAQLEIVERLVADGALARYHLLHAVRADVLVKLGRTREARVDFERAAALTLNARERASLLERADRYARVT